MTIYPVEKFIELDNNPYLLGRITVIQVNDLYNAEVDIIYKESHKIFKHVGIIWREHNGEEALICGVQKLRQFLEAVEKDISNDPQSSEEAKNKSDYH
jgi:hypothetical protein